MISGVYALLPNDIGAVKPLWCGAPGVANVTNRQSDESKV